MRYLKVSKNGQVVIPKAFREALLIESGTAIASYIHKGLLVLRPSKPLIAKFGVGRPSKMEKIAARDAIRMLRDKQEYLNSKIKPIRGCFWA